MSGGEVDVDTLPLIRPRLVVPPGDEDLALDAVVTGASYLLDAVISGWPVATGLSISLWRRNGTRLTNSADYAAYVHLGLYLRLIEQALPEAVAVAQRELDKQVAQRRRGKQDFRAQARAAHEASERRRAGLSVVLPTAPGIIPPTVVSPLTPSAFSAFADVLVDAAALREARALRLEAGLLRLIERHQVSDVLRYLREAGRVAEADRILTAMSLARDRA